MSTTTSIEWTRGDDGSAGATWNPVTGCTKVSEGCDHCYAQTFAERWRGVKGHPFEQGFDIRLWPGRLELPLRWRKPRRIFLNSMSDLWHDAVDDGFLAQVFAVIALARRHTFQVLTKRPGRMGSMLASGTFWDLVRTALRDYGTPPPAASAAVDARFLPNLWLGVSVESHKQAFRLDKLTATTAGPVRFASCEPLLGPLDLRPWLGSGLEWVITGGESGPRARPAHPDWVRSIRDQCQASGVAFLHKQWGEWGPAPWRVDREPGESDADYKKRAEDVCATHAYAAWAHRYGHQPLKAGHRPWSLERTCLPAGQAPIRRWGKKRAGRLLDGRTWDEFPQATAGTPA